MKKSLLFLIVLSITGCMSKNQDANNTNITEQPKMVMSMADISVQTGNLNRAEELYSQAHELEPRQVKPLLGLGDVLAAQGKNEEAIGAYNGALAIEPANAEARYKLATVLYAVDDISLALEQYEVLLKADAKNHHALNGLGIILDHMGEYRIAQYCYKQGLKFSPQDSSLLNNSGMSYALAGQWDAAEYYLNSANKVSDSVRTHDNLALIKDDIQKIQLSAKARKSELSLALQKELMRMLSIDTASPREIKQKGLMIAQHRCAIPIVTKT
jgi:Flp pilus assembly protein TadD